MPSVVTVNVELKQPMPNTARRFVKPGEPIIPAPRENQYAAGTGFVFHEDGYIVTNWHVIRNAINNPSIIRIGFSNYAQYEATVFNYDAISDLAILKIKNEEGEKFPEVEWVISRGWEVMRLSLVLLLVWTLVFPLALFLLWIGLSCGLALLLFHMCKQMQR